MKWKIVAVIAVVLIVTGIAAKLLIDRLFSFIFLTYVGDIEFNLEDIINTIPSDKGNRETGIQEKEAQDGETGDKGEDGEEGEGNKEEEVKIQDGELGYEGLEDAEAKDSKARDGKMGDKEARDDAMKNGTGNGEDGGIGDGEGKAIAAVDGGSGYKDRDENAASGESDGNKPDGNKPGSNGLDGNNPDNNDPGSSKPVTAPGEDHGDKAGKGSETETGNAGNGGSGKISAGGINDGINDGGEGNTAGEEDSTAGKNDAGDGQDAVINVTKEKIEEAEKKVSTGDKVKALDIILRKLKPSDLQILMGILKKGKLTQEDINTAKSIIKNRVTEEEKEVLKKLFYKYESLLE